MALRGRLGLPRIPDGAMAHMKFPVVADGAAFARATGFRPRYELAQAMIDFWTAFPPPVAIPSVPPPPPDESEPVMRHD
jgi:UDP-glucose 4-epimerase